MSDLYSEMAVPVLLEHQGEPATYVAGSADGVAITAILSQVTEEQSTEDHGRTDRRVGTVTISTGADGIADPAAGDVITIAGQTYAVERVTQKIAGIANLAVVAVESLEKAQRSQYMGR